MSKSPYFLLGSLIVLFGAGLLLLQAGLYRNRDVFCDASYGSETPVCDLDFDYELDEHTLFITFTVGNETIARGQEVSRAFWVKQLEPGCWSNGGDIVSIVRFLPGCWVDLPTCCMGLLLMEVGYVMALL